MEAEDDCDDEIAVVACADATMTTTTNNNSNNSNNSDSNSNSVATTLVPWGFYPHAARRPEEGDGPDDALDETDVRWRRKSKHFFILSSSGKPVWSRHGDENALAGFMAVIQALVSFVQGAGDTLRSIELGGGALAVIKVAGPLYLATVSRRRGEGVRMLARTDALPKLESLSLEGLHLSGDAIDVLMSSETLVSLVALDLGRNNLTARHLDVMTEGALFERI